MYGVRGAAVQKRACQQDITSGECINFRGGSLVEMCFSHIKMSSYHIHKRGGGAKIFARGVGQLFLIRVVTFIYLFLSN